MDPMTLGLLALGGFVAYRVLSARRADADATVARPEGPAFRAGERVAIVPSVDAGGQEWSSPFDMISGLGAGAVPGSFGWVDDVASGARSALNRKLPDGYSYRRNGDAAPPLKMGERVTFEVMRGSSYHNVMEGRWEGGSGVDAPGWVNVDRIAHRVHDGSDLPLGRYSVPASDAGGYHQYIDRVAWHPISPSSAGLVGYVERYGKLPALAAGSLLTVVLRDASFTTAVVVVEVRGMGADGAFIVAPKYVYRVLSDSGSGALKLPDTKFEMTAADAVDPSSLLSPAGAATKGWLGGAGNRFGNNTRTLRGSGRS